MKPSIIPHIVIVSLCLLGATMTLTSCGDEPLVEESSSSGRPLKEGEMSTVIFTNRVSSIEEITTRSIPKDKKTVLQDYANHELKGADGGSVGWISGEVRTEYGEEEKQAVTRAFESSNLFGKNSQFRMLVFKAPSGGDVDMKTPIANMECQVNAEGNGASFLPADASLVLPRGKYSFVCFPIDEKYNTWETTQGKFEMVKDEDFVCMHLADKEISTEFTEIPLDQFVRYGYQLTVKFSVNKNLGYVTYPKTYIDLQISDAGSGNTGRVINTQATFDIKNHSVTYMDGSSSIDSSIAIEGYKTSMTYTPVTNFLIANNDAKQKLTIKYPDMVILKPAATDGNAEDAIDSLIMIKAGTYTTDRPVRFQSGKSYTITLAVGEQVKGIMVGGVIWASGNLDYNETTKKFFFAPNPRKAKTAREARGAWFRWFSPLPQSESNTSVEYPIKTTWTVTTPMWSGNSTDLGNYNGYYKGVFGENSDLISGTLPATLTATTLGDPCWGMGKGWRMPTYNELYLLCYVSPSATPSGTFTTKRNRLASYSSYSASFNENIMSSDAIYSGNYITASDSPNENPEAIKSTAQYDGSQLFLPAGGYCSGSYISGTGTFGFYWISTPQSGSDINAWGLLIRNTTLDFEYSTRNYGQSVRCVLGD